MAGSGRTALVVVGPSRSGSSALARVMNLCGAALPATLLPGGLGNDAGHFEPARLVALHDRILAGQGATWWEPLPLPTDWLLSPAAEAHAIGIAEIIAEEYGAAPLILIKDPRLCRLLPLTLRALEILGIAARIVLCVREPGESARSLTRRDGTDPLTAELLVVRDLLGMEGFSRAAPRVWSGYAGLLADWRGAMAHVARGLGIVWPSVDAAAIEGFLDPALRHEAPTGAPSAGPLALRLWAACALGVAGDDAAARAAFDPVRAVSDELDRLSAPLLNAVWWQRAQLRTLAAHRDAG